MITHLTRMLPDTTALCGADVTHTETVVLVLPRDNGPIQAERMARYEQDDEHCEGCLSKAAEESQ